MFWHTCNAACLGFFGNNGSENVHKVFSSFGKLGWFLLIHRCIVPWHCGTIWIGALANPYYKKCAYPRCQQSVTAVAVIPDEVEGLWIVGGISRRQWQASGRVVHHFVHKWPEISKMTCWWTQPSGKYRWQWSSPPDKTISYPGSQSGLFGSLFGFYAPIQVHVPAWHVVCTHAFVPRQCKTLLQFFQAAASSIGLVYSY